MQGIMHGRNLTFQNYVPEFKILRRIINRTRDGCLAFVEEIFVIT